MQIRNFRWDDLPVIVDFMNTHNETFGLQTRTTIEQIERSWRMPYNFPERDIFVAQHPDGRIVGYTIADLLDEPNYAYGIYQVLPGNMQVGRALMQAATDHFRSTALANSAPDVPIAMEWRLPDHNQEPIELCKEQGFEQVRQFYTMRIMLDQPIQPVLLPDGFVCRPFSAADLEGVHRAKVEIFEDHWGDQHDPLEEWKSQIEHPQFDPTLWWIAYSGDAIAGMVLSQPLNQERAGIGIVGVRRQWRGLGLANALLLQCFAEYQRRGFQSVELGVDSNSQTNAVKLYQRAGMTIHQTILYYRHLLRGNLSEVH